MDFSDSMNFLLCGCDVSDKDFNLDFIDMPQKHSMTAGKHHSRRHRQYDFHEGDPNYISFSKQLLDIGLKIRNIKGDGNCLFRSFADQLNGTDSAHIEIRRRVVHHMLEHQENFEPFVEDDVPFDRYVENLYQDGTFGGNDSIVAFAQEYRVTVVIHQLGEHVWCINGGCKRQVHLAYHNYDHYSSLRKVSENSIDEPPNILMDLNNPTSPKFSSTRCKYPWMVELVKSELPYVNDELIFQAINKCGEDVNDCVEYIFQKQEDSLLAASEESSRNVPECSVKPKQKSYKPSQAPHLSNRRRKEEAKRERKTRRNESKPQAEETLTPSLQALNI